MSSNKRYRVDFHKQAIEEVDITKSISKFELTLYIILALIPAAIIFSLIHETGHILAAKLLGYEIAGVNINLFPFLPDIDNSWVNIFGYCEEMPKSDYIVIAIAGSIHTLIWSYIFFILYYKFKFHPFIEILLFLYSVMLFLDVILYPIIDIFFLQCCDFYKVFVINPIIVGVILSLGIINFILFIVFFKRIVFRVDVIINEE
ncbi:MAG: hypothetical protein ACFFDB_00455 [Promethearchaeota archaeon]